MVKRATSKVVVSPSRDTVGSSPTRVTKMSRFFKNVLYIGGQLKNEGAKNVRHR